MTKIFLFLLFLTQISISLSAQEMIFNLQKCDAEGRETIVPTRLDPTKTAIVVIDMWNSHWCMTAAQRVGAMVPRMNRTLDAARRAGMTVVWNPSDVVTAYSGYPQYERAMAVEHRHAPEVCEGIAAKFTARSGGCLCGPGLECHGNYGWDAMHPDLVIDDNDFFSASTDEIYSLLTERGITTIIYMGVHTNMCVFGKPGAMSPMWQAGFDCILARDLNDAFTTYQPEDGYTPDDGTADIDRDLMRAGIPCILLSEDFRRAGLWTDASPVDYVRFTPWGKPDRPYFMEQPTAVSLTAPRIDGAEIRYTTDGSEPTVKSTLYTKPIVVDSTVTLRATAFVKGRPASLPSEAFYVKMAAAEPPKPDVYLENLPFVMNDYLKRVHGCAWMPQRWKSFEGKPLRIRAKTYAHGIGMRAPASVGFDLRPEYRRFVALAGVDENMLQDENGRFIAIKSSVIFRVFIDGRLAAESPVMLISQAPWRFDVEIPAGSRLINLSCMDAGSRSSLDYGNWVDAGFVTE
jgi:nicotinamidase-related amidase